MAKYTAIYDGQFFERNSDSRTYAWVVIARFPFKPWSEENQAQWRAVSWARTHDLGLKKANEFRNTYLEYRVIYATTTEEPKVPGQNARPQVEKIPSPTCRRCGDILVGPESLARGYGDKCWRKHRAEQRALEQEAQAPSQGQPAIPSRAQMGKLAQEKARAQERMNAAFEAYEQAKLAFEEAVEAAWFEEQPEADEVIDVAQAEAEEAAEQARKVRQCLDIPPELLELKRLLDSPEAEEPEPVHFINAGQGKPGGILEAIRISYQAEQDKLVVEQRGLVYPSEEQAPRLMVPSPADLAAEDQAEQEAEILNFVKSIKEAEEKLKKVQMEQCESCPPWGVCPHKEAESPKEVGQIKSGWKQRKARAKKAQAPAQEDAPKKKRGRPKKATTPAPKADN